MAVRGAGIPSSPGAPGATPSFGGAATPTGRSMAGPGPSVPAPLGAAAPVAPAVTTDPGIHPLAPATATAAAWVTGLGPGGRRPARSGVRSSNAIGEPRVARSISVTGPPAGPRAETTTAAGRSHGRNAPGRPIGRATTRRRAGIHRPGPNRPGRALRRHRRPGTTRPGDPGRIVRRPDRPRFLISEAPRR